MSNDENAIHFGAIRQAFSNNNAAVMVGAGFSRNAEGGDSLPGTDISDEHIPLLRYYSARLAYATALNSTSDNFPSWANLWIDAAKVDPLPDLRYMKN